MLEVEQGPARKSAFAVSNCLLHGHLSACVPGRLTGVAVPVHVERPTIVLQTSIYRSDGKLAAMMIQTQMVLPRGSATPAGEGGDEA
jgi:acyl-coenzyme A thioesterase PaaI-like protein